MGEFAVLVPAPILEMTLLWHPLLPVLQPVLLPVLQVLLPVLPHVLLPPLLNSYAFVKEVTGTPGEELALLASGALWHPHAVILVMLLFMRENALLLITPALHVISA